MEQAVAQGKQPDARAWCKGVLSSTDPRIPRHWRSFAFAESVRLLIEGAGIRHPHDWARKLREREECGEVLCHAQQRAWRQVLGIPSAEVASE